MDINENKKQSQPAPQNDPQSVRPDKPEKDDSPDKPTGTKPEVGELKGLCINCENRFTCILPKPAGGVWHCEEYR